MIKDSLYIDKNTLHNPKKKKTIKIYYLTRPIIKKKKKKKNATIVKCGG